MNTIHYPLGSIPGITTAFCCALNLTDAAICVPPPLSALNRCIDDLR